VSVTAPKGFIANGVHAGIRRQKLDLAIVRSTLPAVGAGMFTINRVQAAPVRLCKASLALEEPWAVVANSGNANACTGLRGDIDARAVQAEAARLLGLKSEQVLVLSTGVIGQPLPMGRILPALRPCADGLAEGPDAGKRAAEAIMTTDLRSKESVAHGPGFTVGGTAKGSGMIHPNMATMLAIVTTDYPLASHAEALALLRPAVHESFNAITVDGDCSTNDTLVLLANGASGVTRTPATDAAFVECLRSVCMDLSAQVVADGEGCTVVAEVKVTGAANDDEARAIAQRIATSPLVKTALFGHDANWGRVLSAAGSAPYNGGYAHLDPDRVCLRYNGTLVLDRGAPTGVEPDVSGSDLTIELDLDIGDGRFMYLTSDFSYEYVRINADYRT
jgi:glutamate N-acetyltransferase/amino-acid N-acetyltransferase